METLRVRDRMPMSFSTVNIAFGFRFQFFRPLSAILQWQTRWTNRKLAFTFVQPEKVAWCFVLNDCSDDSGILADIADQNVLLPKESTGQTFLTPTASTASTTVDTRRESVSDVCVVDNDDETSLIEPDYKSGWDTRFKSGACRGMLYGVVLRENPNKAVSKNMRQFPPRTHEHHRIDATFFTAQNRRTDIRCSASELLRRVISQGFESIFRQDNVQAVREMRHTSRLDSMTGSKTRADPGENSLHTKGIYCADHGTFIDSVLREIYDAYKAARSRPSNCDGDPAHHVLKRQPDLATKMMSEQASLSSNGNYEQSTILLLSLDCIDQAVEPITEFVLVRERSMHSEDNQTLCSRDVDPTAYDGVWAIIDDGCNSCCRGEVWRRSKDELFFVSILFGCTDRRLFSTA